MKVTEEVHKNIEVRLKESAEFQTQLEKKLMEVEKEKQELQDDKRKAIESMEQQVSSLGFTGACFLSNLSSLY
jgi:nucleoprotein TPR